MTYFVQCCLARITPRLRWLDWAEPRTGKIRVEQPCNVDDNKLLNSAELTEQRAWLVSLDCKVFTSFFCEFQKFAWNFFDSKSVQVWACIILKTDISSSFICEVIIFKLIFIWTNFELDFCVWNCLIWTALVTRFAWLQRFHEFYLRITKICLEIILEIFGRRLTLR